MPSSRLQTTKEISAKVRALMRKERISFNEAFNRATRGRNESYRSEVASDLRFRKSIAEARALPDAPPKEPKEKQQEFEFKKGRKVV